MLKRKLSLRLKNNRMLFYESNGECMKTIMLLGGSAQQIIAIATAKRIGLHTVLCDYLPDNPGQYHADKFYQVSTTDKEAILKVARDEHIDYILAYASDPAAPTAAFVAEKLGLPTNPYKAVEILCNKDLFRQFLSSHHFNTPYACGFSTKEDAFAAIEKYSFPVIIKPVDSSGSKGATVLKTIEELDGAIDFAFSFSRCHRIIIEEFIEKKHPYLIGGDVFVSGGKIIQWGLMNCHRDDHVNSLVPVGKSYPPCLSDENLQAVKDTLQQLVTELNIKFGPMNVELVVDKNDHVYPIDIGPRSGGNMIPDLLGMIFNCNLVEMTVRSAMGENITNIRFEDHGFYATHNLHSDRNGLFDHVEYSEEIRQYTIRENVYKQSGDPVSTFTNAAYAIGIVFMKFPDNQTMLRILDNISEHIRIILKEDLQ